MEVIYRLSICARTARRPALLIWYGCPFLETMRRLLRSRLKTSSEQSVRRKPSRLKQSTVEMRPLSSRPCTMQPPWARTWSVLCSGFEIFMLEILKQSKCTTGDGPDRSSPILLHSDNWHTEKRVSYRIATISNISKKPIGLKIRRHCACQKRQLYPGRGRAYLCDLLDFQWLFPAAWRKSYTNVAARRPVLRARRPCPCRCPTRA